MKYKWDNISTIASQSYVCGYCGKDVASEKAFYSSETRDTLKGRIYVCHHCHRPTFFDVRGHQFPGASFGEAVEDIADPLVAALYEESRRCISASAYTSCVLTCRKLLMHVAVSKGAETNKSFIYYVEYLSEKGYVPPGAKDWIDHIRTKGNEATHEIVVMSKDDAEELVSFTSMLLKIMFEFPAKVAAKYAAKKS